MTRPRRRPRSPPRGRAEAGSSPRCARTGPRGRRRRTARPPARRARDRCRSWSRGSDGFLVDGQVRGRSPARGVERTPELLDGLRHRLHVGGDDDRAALLDDPLRHVGRVGRSRRVVEGVDGAVEPDHGRRGGRPRIDPDDHPVASLHERLVLDPSRRSRSTSTRTSPAREFDTGMSSGRASTANVAFA